MEVAFLEIDWIIVVMVLLCGFKILMEWTGPS